MLRTRARIASRPVPAPKSSTSPVWQAKPARAPRLELLDQARLADPGLAADVDRPPAPARAAGGQAARNCPARLPRPTNGRRGRAAGAQAAQPPGAHRLGEALDRERLQLVAVEPLDERAPHRVGDQDLARPRGVGQARGEVHRVAGDRVLAVAGAPGAARHHLAAGDADVHVQPAGRPPPRRSGMASRMASAARTARSASLPWATGAPKTAMTQSPMCLSIRPPCSSTIRSARSKKRPSSACSSSASSSRLSAV